jgi:hypothetical protein
MRQMASKDRKLQPELGITDIAASHWEGGPEPALVNRQEGIIAEHCGPLFVAHGMEGNVMTTVQK